VTVNALVPLLFCLVLVAANAAFVAAEFSLVTVDRGMVQDRAEAGVRRARVLRHALRTLSTQLSGAQLGITVTSLVVGFLAEPAIASLLRGPLLDLGVPEAAVTGLSVGLALAIATGLQMVFGELVPKNLAIAQPLRVGMFTAPAQVGFTRVAGPLIRFLNGNANWLLRRIGIEPQEELASARSPQELASLVRRSAEVGTLPGDAAHLIAQALDFGDLTAGDVLTPRRRVRFLNLGDSVADLLELVSATGHSRFPVAGPGGKDDVTQMAQLRMALRVPAELRARTPIADIARPATLVPDSMPLGQLLERLRQGQGQLAVVLDEYGGTAGVVTLEDLVEELVGEVRDEHDPHVLRVRHLDDGALLVSGLLRTDELHDEGIPIPDHDAYDTLGGFLTAQLGRLGAVGDQVRAPGWLLTVVRVDGRRIDVVRAEPTDPSAQDQQGDGGPDSPRGAAE
jgi:CBS domain containing-hemolysin-like protein